jgi:hypothetical protein
MLKKKRRKETRHKRIKYRGKRKEYPRPSRSRTSSQRNPTPVRDRTPAYHRTLRQERTAMKIARAEQNEKKR